MPQLFARRLYLLEVTPGLGAGFVQIESSGAPDSSNWPAGSRLMLPSGPDSAMAMVMPSAPCSMTGFQPILLQLAEQRRGCHWAHHRTAHAWSPLRIDEFLVLGTDPPAHPSASSPPGETGDQLVARLDQSG